MALSEKTKGSIIIFNNKIENKKEIFRIPEKKIALKMDTL
jgi:hypothetical protein